MRAIDRMNILTCAAAALGFEGMKEGPRLPEERKSRPFAYAGGGSRDRKVHAEFGGRRMRRLTAPMPGAWRGDGVAPDPMRSKGRKCVQP